MALSSRHIGKYEFSTGEDIWTEIGLLIKGLFEYSPLGSELKKQIHIAKKQYRGLDKVYEFDKKEGDKKPVLKKHNKSNLVYEANYSFHKYHDVKNMTTFVLN